MSPTTENTIKKSPTFSVPSSFTCSSQGISEIVTSAPMLRRTGVKVTRGWSSEERGAGLLQKHLVTGRRRQLIGAIDVLLNSQLLLYKLLPIHNDIL